MRGEFRKSFVGDLYEPLANVAPPVLSVQSRKLPVMSVRVEFRWSEDLLARVDAAAGFESRASWVRRVVEAALDEPVEIHLPYQSPEQEAELRRILAEANARVEARTTRRVSPSGPASPRVPFRRDVKPFQRGGS